VVSQDPLIHTILSNHKVDIVISSGCLTALVGLAESTDVELEIPIKVVEINKGILFFFFHTKHNIYYIYK
jgi:hypothetical protein